MVKKVDSTREDESSGSEESHSDQVSHSASGSSSGEDSDRDYSRFRPSAGGFNFDFLPDLSLLKFRAMDMSLRPKSQWTRIDHCVVTPGLRDYKAQEWQSTHEEWVSQLMQLDDSRGVIAYCEVLRQLCNQVNFTVSRMQDGVSQANDEAKRLFKRTARLLEMTINQWTQISNNIGSDSADSDH